MRATLTNNFDAIVSQVLAVFGSAAHGLQSSASTMSSAAEQTTQQSAVVAAATEEATMNV
jgi:methyl-accepting chemotaxis protein